MSIRERLIGKTLIGFDTSAQPAPTMIGENDVRSSHAMIGENDVRSTRAMIGENDVRSTRAMIGE